MKIKVLSLKAGWGILICLHMICMYIYTCLGSWPIFFRVGGGRVGHTHGNGAKCLNIDF
jgi:hypothetical protein